MSATNDPRCFTCRQTVEEPPVLNYLEDGVLCPACRDRVLDSLPSLLPSSPTDVEIDAEHDDPGSQGPRSLVLVEPVAEQRRDDPPQPA